MFKVPLPYVLADTELIGNCVELCKTVFSYLNYSRSQMEANNKTSACLFTFYKSCCFHFKMNTEPSEEICSVKGLFACCNSGLKVMVVNRVILAHKNQ